MGLLMNRVKASVVEDGDCWRWTGAMSNGSSPVVWWQDKVMAVRRILLAERDVSLSRKVASTSCGNLYCVNPDHLVAATRRTVSRRTVESTGYTRSLVRAKKIADFARTRGKLDQEKAREIRESGEPQAALAQRYGVSQAAISAVKTGKVWKTYVNPFAGLVP